MPLHQQERYQTRSSLLLGSLVLLLLLVVFGWLDFRLISQPARKASQKAKSQLEEEAAASEVKTETYTAAVLAAGDNLAQNSLTLSGQYESGRWDYSHVYAHVQSWISEADLAILHQDTPFTQSHDLVSGSAPYAAPTELGDAIAGAGFDVVASASEYMDDQGDELIDQTLSFWSSSHPEVTVTGLNASREDAESLALREVNGIRIALLNYTFPSYVYTEPQYEEIYNEETGEYSYELIESDEDSWRINTFHTQKVSAMLEKAREQADCIIFCAHWGRSGESMPTEYEKEWAAFLLKEGVDVVLGSHPHVLQPYGTLSDEDGHSMLIFYSLGNFVTGQETLSQLLGGVASFTIEKTVTTFPGEAGTESKSEVKILQPALTPVVMHYDYDGGEYGVYPLEDYTDELAASHSLVNYIGLSLSVSELKERFDAILSLNVTPSERTDFLDVSFDSEGYLYDQDGNYLEDSYSQSASSS